MIRHPMSQLCGYLLEAEPSTLDRLLFITGQAVADAIEDRLGQAHMESISQRSFLITRLTSERLRVREMHVLIQKSQMSIPLDQRQLYLWRDFSGILLDQEDFEGVVKGISNLSQQLKESDLFAAPHLLATILACLSISYDQLGLKEFAKGSYQSLLHLLKRRVGDKSKSLVSALLEVESLFYSIERLDQATEIYGLRTIAAEELFDRVEKEGWSEWNTNALSLGSSSSSDRINETETNLAAPESIIENEASKAQASCSSGVSNDRSYGGGWGGSGGSVWGRSPFFPATCSPERI